MGDDDRARWLQEKYTEIAALAGGLAHEIKNPLSTLAMNLQLIAEDLQNPETQRERRTLQKAEMLQRECRRLQNVLEDFLRYARVSELRLTPTDLAALLRDVLEFLAERARAAGIVIRTDLPDLPPLRLDQELFRQAILNLTLNAFEAMPNGGELIVRGRAEAGWIRIDIIDTGVGMTDETLARIFKPFFSTRKNGTGLGLSTSRKIIETMHGRLTVQSTHGKGTAFTIALPMALAVPIDRRTQRTRSDDGVDVGAAAQASGSSDPHDDPFIAIAGLGASGHQAVE
jgi:signal transduction histidine kinase